jgi:hypothetical protein
MEVGGAAKDFAKNYPDMREANTVGADKCFHCNANGLIRTSMATRRAHPRPINARTIVDAEAVKRIHQFLVK